MNQISKHERPGVYSAYELSSVISGNPGGAMVGLIAISSKGTAGEAAIFYDYPNLVAQFGEADALSQMAALCFRNGASSVGVLPIAEKTQYEAAFARLNEIEMIKLVVCDSTDIAVQQLLRAAVNAAAALRRERLAVVCGGTGETVTELIARAAQLNSERMVLVAPECNADALQGVLLAAAVAGAIAGESDPAVPLGGATLRGLSGLSQTYSESNLDALIRGGVTVAEAVQGDVSVVRGVTTRTTSGDVSDTTWKELSTILIVDYVIPKLRAALKSRFTRAKNTEQVRGAIRSQVILSLEEFLAQEIITAYGNVRVTPDTEDPSICLVQFSFTVTHALNQIWLSANITI